MAVTRPRSMEDVVFAVANKERTLIVSYLERAAKKAADKALRETLLRLAKGIDQLEHRGWKNG